MIQILQEKRAKKNRRLEREIKTAKQIYRQQQTSEYSCPTCSEDYLHEDDDSAVWVESEQCCQWYHLTCTNIPPHLYGNISDNEFICNLCN